ncbi:MAG: hypothetical protein A3H36_01645 [Chloroflexi bacterium RIFCSPLOWO2_02_FULL_71_16]|nr:MAG: hypothetical protein A3H36_01645 [Chloroflexi bacterium RIFCSPLOWO2_02_FULL_71_16]
MSWPHDGCGGWEPRPRNESAASARIAKAVARDACTMSAFDALGKMCRRTMRSVGTPTMRAARMKSRSRSESTWPRVRRV